MGPNSVSYLFVSEIAEHRHLNDGHDFAAFMSEDRTTQNVSRFLIDYSLEQPARFARCRRARNLLPPAS